MGSIFVAVLVLLLIINLVTKKDSKVKCNFKKLGTIRSIPIDQTSSIKEVITGLQVLYDPQNTTPKKIAKFISESDNDYIIQFKNKRQKVTVCKTEIKALILEIYYIDKDDITHISYIGLDNQYWETAILNDLIDSGIMVEYEVTKCPLTENSNIATKAILKLK
jgi:hypothetical protein